MTETETISISSKPGIKCFLADARVRDTLEKFRKLPHEEILWTGESTHCVCNHHVEQHYTFRDQYNRITDIHCHGSNELCNCEDFRTRSIRLSHSNCYKMVTEE